MENIQDLVDHINEENRLERSKTQMTLGKLISLLESLPKDMKIQNITNPNSYRGYYSDLCFKLGDGILSIEELLSNLKYNCINTTFEGYKGGDFNMVADTPIWIANYGCIGLKIVELKYDNIFYFGTKEDN